MASLALGRPPPRERAVATDSNPPLMRPPGPNRSRWRARLESQGHVAGARGDFRVRNLCARTAGRPRGRGGWRRARSWLSCSSSRRVRGFDGRRSAFAAPLDERGDVDGEVADEAAAGADADRGEVAGGGQAVDGAPGDAERPGNVVA